MGGVHGDRPRRHVPDSFAEAGHAVELEKRKDAEPGDGLPDPADRRRS